MLGLILLVIVEPEYRSLLYNLSFPLIIELQSNSTELSKLFFMTVSALVFIVIGGTLAISYLFLTRQRAFYYFLLVVLMEVVMSVGKLAYHQPRPYMVDDRIQVYGCSTEYGHPSGHSLNAMTFSLVVLLDYLTCNP